MAADTNGGVPEYSYRWWINQLDKDEKRLKTSWWDDADKVVKKFKGKKNTEQSDQYLLNIFWANVGVMTAALYGKKPRPLVEPIWKDADDPIARVAALMLERCLSWDLVKNESPMDAAVALAVEDWLIPGLGQVWFRYESEIETQTVPGTSISFDVVKSEQVACDYVHWRDFVMPAARTVGDVWYMGRKIYMSKADIEAKFKITIDEKDPEGKARDADNVLPKNFAEDKVCLYELWCKKCRKIYWVCREIPDFCQEKEDFLKLTGFYPAPMPLMANNTTDDYIPRPDYVMMRDQYDQLNELNTRIVILEKALRVVGVYDKQNAEVSRILSEARENDMIPVEKWAGLAEAGGLKGVVDWFPVEIIAEVLDKLREQKAEKKQEIYELSGISDIMRGATNPRETLGAQKLKAQYGSVRLEARQEAIAQFVRRALTIKAEIICEHFQPQTIVQMSNIQARPDDQQVVEPAIQLLKNSKLLHYRVDINESNLALPDYQQEQENRTEFLTTTGQFLSQAGPILEQVPGALPHLLGMIRWVASGLRGSKEIMGVMDEAIQAAQQPQQKQDGQPEDVVGAEMAKAKGALVVKQLDGQQKLEQIQKTEDLELRNALIIKGQEDKTGMQQTALEGQQDMQATQIDQQHDMRMGAIQHAQTMQANQQTHAQTMQAGERQHAQGMEMADAQHQNTLEQGEQSGDVQLAVSKLRSKTGNSSKNK